MAGHSKWANIKHRKAVVDARRGKLFTRISREIIVAARLGGGDPESNPRLRMAISNARAVSMPTDNIKRAIQRGTGEIEGAVYEDLTLEGYGPGGVAIIVECTTENRNRTIADVRAAFSKCGGNLGENNSVSWSFERRGTVRLITTDPEERLLEVAIDAGADHVEMVEDGAVLLCAPDVLGTVANHCDAAGYQVAEQQMVYQPQQMMTVNDPLQAKKVIKLLETFEEHDDIQQVYTNADLPDDVMDAA